MPRYFPDKKTKATTMEVFAALQTGWRTLFRQDVSDEVIFVLLAQWTIETGGGLSMHHFNLGNLKAVENGDHDWTFFSCNEFLVPARAQALLAKASARKDGKPGLNVTVDSALNEEGKVEVWVHPNHPGCCFRVFHTLEEGVVGYLQSLQNRFPKAWSVLELGDPTKFSRALSAQGYYTAVEAKYTAAMVYHFNHLKNVVQKEQDRQWVIESLHYLGHEGSYDKMVRAFQKKHGLKVDGDVGEMTTAKLQERLAAVSDEATEIP